MPGSHGGEEEVRGKLSCLPVLGPCSLSARRQQSGPGAGRLAGTAAVVMTTSTHSTPVGVTIFYLIYILPTF